METKRLLEIDNHHVDEGPTWMMGDLAGKHVSYFENAYGEQWVFLYDGKTHQAELWGGDCGWKVIPVTEQGAQVILNEAEQLWLRACWLAATKRYGRE
jgi:hypothetical protein